MADLRSVAPLPVVLEADVRRLLVELLLLDLAENPAPIHADSKPTDGTRGGTDRRSPT